MQPLKTQGQNSTSPNRMLSSPGLPLVSGPQLRAGNSWNLAGSPAIPAYQPIPSVSGSVSTGDIVALLEKPGQLRDAGFLTPDEFAAQKTELLRRL